VYKKPKFIQPKHISSYTDKTTSQSYQNNYYFVIVACTKFSSKINTKPVEIRKKGKKSVLIEKRRICVSGKRWIYGMDRGERWWNEHQLKEMIEEKRMENYLDREDGEEGGGIRVWWK